MLRVTRSSLTAPVATALRALTARAGTRAGVNGLKSAEVFSAAAGAGGASSVLGRMAGQSTMAMGTIGARGYASEAVMTVDTPEMGDSISSGTVADWEKGVGDYVEADEVVCMINTDKIAVPITAPQAGVITEILVDEDEEAEVGTPLYKLDTAASAPEAKADSAEEPAAEAKEEAKEEAAPAKEEKPAAAKETKAAAKPAAAKPAAAKPAAKTMTGARTETRVKMTRMRQTIAARLKESQNTAALLTTFQEIDMTELMALRKKHQEAFVAKHGVKLGFMSPFIKASAKALQEVPAINAVIDETDVVYRDYVDISVAVATPNGLVVPVVRNAESLSFADAEHELARLAAKARENQISLDDMAGGTFTISNGGVYGSLLGTPILQSGQSAVLGMHGVFPRLREVDGEFVKRSIMIAALTYDHRLVDGREAATFLRTVKQGIEDPTSLLFDL
ncbi:dihydrolipoamide succinyltransferase [Thecamonas trahens ATCC 50062]|uniref:dihydrolipoyllysine-residue succinyltransferase n=1 Tax=Thecamonas trahens ATCC 50062 TaxID=461836 RepID=A0A0L0D265_THETB|nr:dihydrolipoamide succinyltransferase [Thecamonas trahens ATCC 50062]KNC46439.1 dihydrolipoamide succinyltransferase [Thecamonas trahens ATCC 50062]|eukprot:XP_013760730.1 dihydrolipoamide succinyltransferase [Thecamonas trahens ATCC 50062]